MNIEDRLAIIEAVQSFRIGAALVIEDVRLACWADGHPINHVSSKEIPCVLRTCCEPLEGLYGRKDRKSWIRKI